MSDSDEIVVNKKDDLMVCIIDFISSIKYKHAILILLTFIFISSDVFIGRVLSKFNSAVELNNVTNYGVFLQGLMLVLVFIIIDILISNDVI